MTPTIQANVFNRDYRFIPKDIPNSMDATKIPENANPTAPETAQKAIAPLPQDIQKPTTEVMLAPQPSADEFVQEKSTVLTKKKKGFLDKIMNQVKNSADTEDTIVVPRTIFKGYLGIMAGTTLVTVAANLSSKVPNLKKWVNLIGLGVSMYGTYAFVRPFIIKDSQGSIKASQEANN